MGSNARLVPVQSTRNKLITLVGRVTLDSSGVAVSSQNCEGFSVANTSTGVYTITLHQKYLSLAGFSCTVLAAAVTPADKGGLVKVNSAGVTGNTPTTRTIVFMNELPATAGAAGVVKNFQNSAVLLITLVMDQGMN